MTRQHVTHEAGMSLVTMAVILTILGAIMAGLLPMLMNRLQGRSQNEAREIVRRVRDEIVGYAMQTCSLPATLNDTGARTKGRDGQELGYHPAPDLTVTDGLKNLHPALLIANNISDDDQYQSSDEDPTYQDDVAFILAHKGPPPLDHLQEVDDVWEYQDYSDTFQDYVLPVTRRELNKQLEGDCALEEEVAHQVYPATVKTPLFG